jgi:hypothetical protein
MENLEPYFCVRDLLLIGLSIEALQIDIKQVCSSIALIPLLEALSFHPTQQMPHRPPSQVLELISG